MWSKIDIVLDCSSFLKEIIITYSIYLEFFTHFSNSNLELLNSCPINIKEIDMEPTQD
jgi:hypothetical protein